MDEREKTMGKSMTPEQTVLAIRALARTPWAAVSTSSFHLSKCVCGVPMWQQPCAVCDYYFTHSLPSNECHARHERQAEACRERTGDPRTAFRKAIENSGDEELGYEGNLATFYIRSWRRSCAWNPSAQEDNRPRFWRSSYRRLTEEQAKFRIELQALEIRAARLDCASPDDIFDTVCEGGIKLPRYYGEHFGLARIVEDGLTPETADDYILNMLDDLVGHELIASPNDFTLTERGREVHRTYAFERSHLK